MNDGSVEDPSKVDARRHPHQVFLAAFMVLVGIPVLVGGPQPNSLAASLPTWLLYVWAATLVFGGLLVLGAAVVRSPVNALYMECVAHLPLALASLAYVVALAGVNGWKALAAGSIVVGFAIASGARSWQVFSAVASLQRAVARSDD